MNISDAPCYCSGNEVTVCQCEPVLLSREFERGSWFSRQVRKRHCLAKGVQLVDAVEVYHQRKNGELIVHSERSVKKVTSSPQTVSNIVVSLTKGLLDQEELKKKFTVERLCMKCSLLIQFQKSLYSGCTAA